MERGLLGVEGDLVGGGDVSRGARVVRWGEWEGLSGGENGRGCQVGREGVVRWEEGYRWVE